MMRSWIMGVLLCLGAACLVRSEPEQTLIQATVRMPRRLALLVGIGKYYQLQPRTGEHPWPELHTSTELTEYQHVLSLYGFEEHDVEVLSDQQATKSNILRAFREHLIVRAQPGDVVLFHFSGHGQHLRDDTGPTCCDEADGMDESLVTYDAVDQSHAEGVAKNIRDDELGVLLEELAARMRPHPGAAIIGNITVTLDACFSGSATRGPIVPRGRSWDVVKDGHLPPSRPGLPAEGPAGILAQSGAVHSDVTVVAAARSDQSAWERSGQGVFTKHWVRLLARKSQSLTYRAAVERMAVDLYAEGLDQVPQVDGAADKPIFSSGSTPSRQTDRVWRALRDGQGTLWLQAGDVHGVTQGSRYTLYEPEASSFVEGASLGQAEVSRVLLFSAQLVLAQGTMLSDRSGVQAVESHKAYPPSPLRIWLSDFPKEPTLQARIGQLGVVRTVSERDDFDLAVHYRPHPDGPTVELQRPTSLRPYAAVRLGENGSEALAQRLIAEYRRSHLASFRRENPEARVDLELLPVEAQHGPSGHLLGTPRRLTAPPPSSHVELPREAAFGLRLHNRSQRDLFVALLAVSPDGDIEILHGKEAGDNLIRAGQSLELPLNLKLFWVVEQPGEKILIKVFATTSFVDFSSLQSSQSPAAARSVQGPGLAMVGSSALQRLLNDLVSGRFTRSVSIEPMDWGTTDASVTIK